MRDGQSGTKALILSSILALCCPLLAAHATTTSQPHAQRQASHSLRAPTAHIATHGATRVTSARGVHVVKSGKAVHGRQMARSGGISCVPYARNVSGIQVSGNAWQWWNNAEGTYARGRVPEAGSVLTFRANGRMRLGHVAVVSRVINAREIEIDHANWGGYYGGVGRGVTVVDVSEANN